MSVLYEVKNLRHNIQGIPNDHPGYYKWWARKEDLLSILDKLQLDYDTVADYLDIMTCGDDTWYCIYVGVTIKDSIQKRLNWHINDKHTKSSVMSGFLSTLRQSISSLFGTSQMDEQATNEFLDRLLVEFFVSEHAIKSEEARLEIHTWEESMLNSDRLYILNIQGNKHPLAPRKTLLAMRKAAKRVD